MALSTTSALTYASADFTTSSGLVNPISLKQEFLTAALSVAVASVQANAATGGASIYLDGLPTAADITAANAVVAAHTGLAFAVTPLRSTAPAMSSDDSGNFVDKVTLTTGPLRAGTYLVTFYMELSTTTTAANTAAAGRLMYSKNGAAPSVLAEGSSISSNFVSMSGSMISLPIDGDSFTLTLQYSRVGTAGNAARAQRGRLLYIKID